MGRTLIVEVKAQEKSYISEESYLQAILQPPNNPTITAGRIKVSDTSKEYIREEIRSVFGTYAKTAIRIAMCESNLRPDALNDNSRTGDYSVGIFQINLYGALAKNRPSEEWLLIPKNNISYAYQMFLESGRKFTPWTCAKMIGAI